MMLGELDRSLRVCTLGAALVGILVVGCGEASEPKTSETGVQVMALKSDIPKCDPSRLGQVFFAEDEESFYYCDGQTLRLLELSGDPGETSAAWLIATSSANLAECEDGGVLIHIGPDTDGDGMLDVSEITSTDAVCNGAAGDDGKFIGDAGVGCDVEIHGDGPNTVVCGDGNSVVVNVTGGGPDAAIGDDPGPDPTCGGEGEPCCSGLACAAGLICSGFGMGGGVCVHDGMGMSVCGNGIVEPGESCDDGNDIEDDECTVYCTIAVCGDGVHQPGNGEECDDGNSYEGDGCTSDCSLAQCGDGVQNFDEECDDGNEVNDDGCTNSCTWPECGDGIHQPDNGEECDDGNDDDDDECRNYCVLAYCGDGVVQEVLGEQCDDYGLSETCGSDCQPLELPPVPDDLPDTPLVYVARSNSNAHGDVFDGVDAGEQAVLVLGVYPQRPCFESSCGYYFDGETPERSIVGYVRIGDMTFPLPADLEGQMEVSNDHELFLEESFNAYGSWERTSPEPTRFSIWVAGSARGNVAGLTSTALPRDVSGLEDLNWQFEVDQIGGGSQVYPFNTEWLVIDNGSECGDGVVAPGTETCDDGGIASGDGCDEACLWELDAPSESGINYGIYGHLDHWNELHPGLPVWLSVHAEAQPTCSDPQSCWYLVGEMLFRAGSESLVQPAGSVEVHTGVSGQYVSLRDEDGVLSAHLEDSSAMALSSAALPTAPLYPEQTFDYARMWFDVPSIVGDSQILSWHTSIIDCSTEPCDCSPADCPVEPFCGVFPDGCGSYVDCGCSGGAACTDGMCEVP